MGKGKLKARLMLIGEAPGAEEDKAGIPFIGRAGELLNSILVNLDFDVPSIYITNAVKCHPAYNHKPDFNKVDICVSNYLAKEIDLIKPELIVVLGQLAAKALLREQKITVDSVRRKVHYTQGPLPQGVPFIITYHPASVFHQPDNLDKIVKDFELVKEHLAGRIKSPKEVDKSKYKYIKSLSKIPNLDKAKWIDLDTETDGLDPFISKKEILSIQFSTKEGNGYYLDWNEQVKREVIAFFRTFTGGINGHNLKHDLKWLREKADIIWDRKINDTQQNIHLLDENLRSKSLDTTATTFTDLKGHKDEFQKLIRERVKLLKQKKEGIRIAFSKYYRKAFFSIPLRIRKEYGAGDADATGRLRRVFIPKLKEENLYPLHQLMMECTKMYVDIECNGMKIDRDSIPVYEEFYSKKINKIKYRMDKLAGHEMNHRSNPQLKQLIYGKFKCIPHEVRVGKKRSMYSSSEDALNLILQDKLSERVKEYIKLLKDFRKTDKLYGTYVKGMPRFLRDGDLIHANWRLDGTVTGRGSCNNPNLQQIPRNGPIKELFISRYPKGVLIQVDVSQGELRVGAHVSEEPTLIKLLCKKNSDIHRDVAVMILNKKPNEITEEEGYNAKQVDFAVFYGTGIRTLAQEMKGVSEREAARFYQAWHKTFPYWNKYVHSVHEFVIEHGYVRSIFGRKRRLTILDPTSKLGMSQLRQAVNSPIQGGLSDYNKLCGYNLWRRLKKEFPLTLIIGEVHDSYMLDSPSEREAMKIASIIRKEFEDVDTSKFGFKFKVPMKIDIKIGYNWRDMEEI
jgi:DNA polymerase-1